MAVVLGEYLEDHLGTCFFHEVIRASKKKQGEPGAAFGRGVRI